MAIIWANQEQGTVYININSGIEAGPLEWKATTLPPNPSGYPEQGWPQEQLRSSALSEALHSPCEQSRIDREHDYKYMA